jgi:hypothetical protein
MELRFPSLGVNRRQVHEKVASAVAYATPYAVNTRLEDDLTNRLRGGAFTGIAAGSRPTLIEYRDRKLTIGDASGNNNAVLASRVGAQTTYDYDTDVSDTMRATVFQFSEAGESGQDVVALVPHKDTYLLAFTATETWVLQGDPLTGAIRRVSDEVGIIGADAWCVAHDTVYFLSSSGLYSVSADGSGLKAISEDKLPEDLTGVSDSACTLTYKHADRGVYIHLTSGVDWFYDTERDGFWGFDTSKTDSHVLIGPLRIGGANQYGLIQTLHGVIGTGSGTVTWRIVTGDSAEEVADDGKAAITADLAGTAIDSYVEAEGAWTANRSVTEWPRVRAAWAIIWLKGTSDWAYESVIMEVMPWGRLR